MTRSRRPVSLLDEVLGDSGAGAGQPPGPRVHGRLQRRSDHGVELDLHGQSSSASARPHWRQPSSSSRRPQHRPPRPAPQSPQRARPSRIRHDAELLPNAPDAADRRTGGKTPGTSPAFRTSDADHRAGPSSRNMRRGARGTTGRYMSTWPPLACRAYASVLVQATTTGHVHAGHDRPRRLIEQAVNSTSDTEVAGLEVQFASTEVHPGNASPWPFGPPPPFAVRPCGSRSRNRRRRTVLRQGIGAVLRSVSGQSPGVAVSAAASADRQRHNGGETAEPPMKAPIDMGRSSPPRRAWSKSSAATNDLGLRPRSVLSTDSSRLVCSTMASERRCRLAPTERQPGPPRCRSGSPAGTSRQDRSPRSRSCRPAGPPAPSVTAPTATMVQ